MHFIAIKFTVRRCTKVIFNITRSFDLIWFERTAFEFVENSTVRLTHHVCQNIQAPPVCHAKDDFLESHLAAAFYNLFKCWNKCFSTIKAKTFCTLVFNVDILLKTFSFNKFAEGGLCGMQTLEERNVELSREVQLLRDGVLRRVLEGGIHDNGGGGVVSAAACAGVIRKWVDANLYETLRLTHGVHAVCAGSEGAMGKCADDCTLTQADGAACVELCVQGLRLMRRQMEMGEVNERNVGCVQRVFDCVHVKLLEKLCRRKDAGGCMQVLENVLRCVLREVRRWYAEIMEGVCIRMRWCEVVTRGVLRRLYEIVKEGWCEGGEIVMGCVVEVLGDVAKRLEGREMDGEMSVGEFCNCCEVSVCVVGAFEEAVLGMKVGVDVVYVIGRHNPVFLRQWLMVQAQEA